MIVLPDLADFPDYLHEPRNITDEMAYVIGPMMEAWKEGDYNKFIADLDLGREEWVVRLEHFFNFYQKWQRPDYSVKELEDGCYVTDGNVSDIHEKLKPAIELLLKEADWTPPPGSFDRGNQVPFMVDDVTKLFEQKGIIDIASKYNRRKMQVANVFLHIATPTDKNWKQFFYDAETTPKYTNTHIDPKEDVVKAMIYLDDVTVDNGAFHYYRGSNQLEIHPVQNVFGRAITTGSYCHTPQARESVFKLPRGLRVSHNFGRCVLPGSIWEQQLDDNLKPIESKEGNIIVFDPGAGIHQGGICKTGNRLALQVLMK